MRSRFSPHHLLWVLPVALLAVAIACGGSTVKSPTAATSADTTSGTTPGTVPPPATGPTSTGTLSVMIKDSPFSEASALLVTFTEVSAHKSSSDGTGDGEWIKLPFEDGGSTRTCNLTRLLAATDVLGVGPLPAGHYTQLRLTVSSVTIYKSTITTGDICTATPTLSSTLPSPPSTPEMGISVTVPSGTLKLNREFTLAADGATTITLDFDGDKSLHMTGNEKYMMTPVIGVVSVQ
jgi:hypothetical protein